MLPIKLGWHIRTSYWLRWGLANFLACWPWSKIFPAPISWVAGIIERRHTLSQDIYYIMLGKILKKSKHTFWSSKSTAYNTNNMFMQYWCNYCCTFNGITAFHQQEKDYYISTHLMNYLLTYLFQSNTLSILVHFILRENWAFSKLWSNTEPKFDHKALFKSISLVLKQVFCRI
jgi:hypothetical protein